MRSRFIIMAVFVFCMMFVLALPAMAADYVGSEKCSMCHMDKFNDWKTSGHPYKLRPVAEARYAALPVPKGYTWDEISYVIGGYRWKSRYIDKKGYIITADKQGKAMPTQFNLATGRWVDYHPGEKKPYKCGPCHMTNYSPKGNQDGMEGMIGMWTFPGIHCEECHGPGSEHAKSGDRKKIKIDRAASACGKCHIRGEAGKIPASKGLIRHHEQYNEYMASPHKDKISCVTCHDPHKPARFGITKECGSCHEKQKKDFSGSTMARSGVTCIDCHMPRIAKSAEAISETEGDVRTHSWRINIDPSAKLLTDDGKFSTGRLPLNVVCLNCHGSRDMKWAVKYASKPHSIGKKM